MYIKSDSNMKFLLLQLLEHAASDDAVITITEALEHMGPRSPYRGGKRLLELLDYAARDAERDDDEQTAAGLHDGVRYATGSLLGPDLEEKYSLYDGRGQADIEMAERAASGLWSLVVQELDDFLKTEPDATAADIRSHFQAMTRTAVRFVRMRRAGYYGAFRIRSEGAAWLTDVLVDRVELLPSTDGDRLNDPRIASLIDLPDAELLLAGAQLMLRRQRLDELRLVVENPFSGEEALRQALVSLSWLWGGDFIRLSTHRRLTVGQEVDLTLLRPGGILHAVELKRANVKIVKSHRSEYVLTAEVHDAIGQMANYLRAFDEHRDEILDEYGIDVRRAHGTVVLGHPMFQREPDGDIVNETIRTYISHLSRIDVTTYEQLLDGAERSLDMAETSMLAGRE